LAIKILLENKAKWRSDNDDSPDDIEDIDDLRKIIMKGSKDPILVVAYTNHALDQFLCHLLEFTDKIVRIGGRCKDDNLTNCMLRNLRRNNKVRMRKGFWNLKKRCDELKDSLNLVKSSLFKKSYLDFESFLKVFPVNYQSKFRKEIANFFSKAGIFFEKELNSKTFEDLFNLWKDSESMTLEKFNQIRLYERNYNKNNLKNPPKVINVSPLQNNAKPFLKNEKLQENLDELESEESEEMEDLDYVENRRLENEFDDLEVDPDEMTKKDFYFCYLTEEERENLAYYDYFGGKNIWDLKPKEREMLFKYSFSLKQKKHFSTYKDKIDEYIQLKREVDDGFLEKDLAILNNCEIVGMTVI